MNHFKKLNPTLIVLTCLILSSCGAKKSLVSNAAVPIASPETSPLSIPPSSPQPAPSSCIMTDASLAMLNPAQASQITVGQTVTWQVNLPSCPTGAELPNGATFTKTYSTVGNSLQESIVLAGVQVKSAVFNVVAASSGSSPSVAQPTPSEGATLSYSQMISMNNMQFVDMLYQVFLGRHPEALGMDYWVNRLQNGETRNEVIVEVVSSDEYFLLTGGSNTSFVTSLYHLMFRRDPDPGGLSGWVNQLDSSNMTRGQVIQGFIESAEFINGP